KSSIFLGRDYNKIRNFSSQVAFQIDEEVRKIISEQYEIARKIISENMDLLKLIAETLMEHETLTKEQIEYLAEHGKMPEDEEGMSSSEDKEKNIDELTLTELRNLAKEKGIKDYKKMTSEELIDVLDK